MFYAFITNNKINGKGQCECTGEDTFSIEITEKVYNNLDHYIYLNGQIILNPNYEQEQLIKQKQTQIEEIKHELDELDLKSIRSIRANETDRISQYEQEAQTLRDELNELISEINELEE